MPKAGGECNSYRRDRFGFEAPISTPNAAESPENDPEPPNRPRRIEIRPSRPNLGADNEAYALATC
jgi:hypothetical protein